MKAKPARARRKKAGVAERAGLPGADAGDAPQDPSFEPVVVGGGRKYLRKRILAEGGMGVVYEAEDLNCRRTVALKILPRDVAAPDEDVVRFIAEAQITSQLEHPNIVPIHELGKDAQGRVFYTMKYVRGRTLTDVLDSIRQGRRDDVDRYPLSRLLNIFQKVCDAIAFAHAREIVHRDVNPNNVMVGDFGEVVLMDWGLAKKMESEEPGAPACGPSLDDLNSVTTIRDKESASLKTMASRVMGTPGFMAPEQVFRGRYVDARADIYSLGAILYNILALRRPVAGKDVMSLLKEIVRGDFPPPASFNQPSTSFPHCPQGLIPDVLSDIAMHALATDPEDRYPAVKELQEEVEAYQGGLEWIRVADEDFREPGIEARWEIMGGQWKAGPGEFRIQGGRPQLLMLKKDVHGDVRIDFECSQEGAYLNDVSCFLGAIPLANKQATPYTGYEFKYGGFENSMTMLIRNEVQLWAEASSPLKSGQRYRMRAERVGSRLRLVVNDREVFNVVDSTPLSGPERTVVGLFGWHADTRYTRIRVYTLKAPWKSDLLDLADRQVQRGQPDVALSLYREVMTLEDPAKARRAAESIETIRRSESLRQELPAIRARIKEAWPAANIQVIADLDGLTVEIAGNQITDLEPLRGAPVRVLHCQDNRIQSLEPLRGMELVSLNCSHNPVTSLEPLRGMPLARLLCERCGVDNLDPLRGMPLRLLNAADNPITTLEALRGLPLITLLAGGTGITDLAPLSGTALTLLSCRANNIRDLAPLKGLPLVMLDCSGNNVASLEPLRDASLNRLHIDQNHLSSLEPLRTCHRLRSLTCSGNRITSIEPVAGLPLGVLACGSNRISSLEPFVEHPPAWFLYDSETLSTREIERARAAWSKQPGHEHLAREADVLLAVLRTGGKSLRRLATAFEGREYLFVPRMLTWEKALTFCEDAGGHLVVIRSQAEQEFLESLLGTDCWVWMGLSVTERGLEWVTGEPVTYTHFADTLEGLSRGPAVFAKRWETQVEPGFVNGFIIEWNASSTNRGKR